MKRLLFFLLCIPLLVKAQCELDFNGIDENGREAVVVKEELLFTYTNPKIEDVIADREFIQGRASAMKMDNDVFLKLKINMSSPHAQEFYGQVTTGQPLKVLFIDREHTFLQVVYADLPKVDDKKGTTEYEIIAKMSNRQAKTLRKCELDALGVVWTSGYEEYAIYDVDFLRNQLTCLKKRS